MHQKSCGPDLKRKLGDNPQLYRNSTSKHNLAAIQPKELPSNSFTRRTSDSTIGTSYVNVSSPCTIETTSTANTSINGDNKTELEAKEIATVKTEHV